MPRDLTLFWFGQTTTKLGSAFTAVAIPLIAVQFLGASGAEMGIITAAGSLSVLLFGLPIATFADRLPRKRPWLVGTELTAAAGVGLLALGVAQDAVGVVALALFAFLLGCLGVLVESIYFVHLNSLVPRTDQVRARAQLQSGEYLGNLMGRGLAGPLITLAGPLGALLVDLGSYLLSALSLLRIRTPEEPKQPSTDRVRAADLFAGFAAILAHPFLRRLTPFLALSQLTAGMVAALTALFLLRTLEIPAFWYGSVFVLSGLCGLAGSALATRLASTVDVRRLVTGGFAGLALATALLPLAAGPLPVAMCIAALGLGLPIFCGALANVGLVGLATRELGEQVLGRFGTSYQVLGMAAFIMGSLSAGWLSAPLGVRPTLWLAVLIGVLALVWLPRGDKTGAAAPVASTAGAP